MIESILLACTRVCTFSQGRHLTNASGFFFSRGDNLFLVTSRHVIVDEPSKHFPDRIEIDLHNNAKDFAQSTVFSIPLYRKRTGVWHQGRDSGGHVDVAVIKIDPEAMPTNAVFRSFTPEHLGKNFEQIDVGTSLLVVGFPLGFHDTLHHLPVVRQAAIASSFGIRFQGEGYFLTDARTHRGTSGAPVVMRARDDKKPFDELPWMLLGVHSTRLDVDTRDIKIDEALGLNCAWYADILMTLTEPE
jgi:S1-C subfamily serine protease